MVSPTDGWAVGDNGTIIHWDGYAWSTVPSPTTQTLNAVSMVSATDGWAVGDGGTILHWDGHAWSRIPSPTADTLRDVMVSATDGWAIGGLSSCSSFGCVTTSIILHWNGQVWSSVPSPTNALLSSIAMLSTNDWWFAGTTQSTVSCERTGCYCTSVSTFLHWNGQMWSVMSGPAIPSISCPATPLAVSSIAMVVPTQGWATGSLGILYWNGQIWTGNSSLVPDWSGETSALVMVTSSEGWAVDLGGAGTILHCSDGIWKSVTSPTSNQLTSVTVAAPNDIWAVGVLGTIIHGTGHE